MTHSIAVFVAFYYYMHRIDRQLPVIHVIGQRHIIVAQIARKSIEKSQRISRGILVEIVKRKTINMQTRPSEQSVTLPRGPE